MHFYLCFLSLLLSFFTLTKAFRSFSSKTISSSFSSSSLASSSSSSESTVIDVDKAISETKQRLFALSATVDRGFGAVKRERDEVTKLVAELSAICVDKNLTRGLFPNTATSSSSTDCPIEGCWRLVYTDALDVLSLAASPLTLLQGNRPWIVS